MQRNDERRGRDRARTEERLIEAAIRILRRDGLGAIGINALAAEAGVSKVLIYRYFGDIEGVHRAIADRLDMTKTAEIVDMLRDLSEMSDLRSDLARVFRLMHERLEGDTVTQELMIHELREENELTRALAEAREEQGHAITRAVAEELVQRGCIPSSGAVDFEAFFALVSAGIYSLTLRSRTVRIFNGIDIRSPEGWERLCTAITDALVLSIEHAS